MHIVTRVFYFFSLFVATVCLVVPMFDHAMSWDEASVGIFSGLFFATVWGVLLLVFLPPRVKGNPYESAVVRRRTAITYGIIGVVFCLFFGSTVTLVCHGKVEAAASRRSSSVSYDRYGYTYRSGYRDTLDEAYARQDSYGREFGIVVVMTSLAPLLGLIVFAFLKPNGASMANAYAQGRGYPAYPQQGYPQQGYPQQGYPQQGGYSPKPHQAGYPANSEQGGYPPPPQQAAYSSKQPHPAHPQSNYPAYPEPNYPAYPPQPSVPPGWPQGSGGGNFGSA